MKQNPNNYEEPQCIIIEAEFEGTIAQSNPLNMPEENINRFFN